MKYIPICALLALLSCGSPSKENDKKQAEETTEEAPTQTTGYFLAISKVDNAVKVFVNDSLIFDSGTIHESPEVDFELNLTPLIVDGSETVKIELWNGVEPYHEQADPLWELRYDLIKDGEIIDFIHEFGDDNAIGLVYENSYIINEWEEENL